MSQTDLARPTSTARSSWTEGMAHDLRFARRQLLRSPGFTLAAVLTLALGIGANAAITSVVRGVLLRPLPNADEARLLYFRQSALGIGVENTWFSVPEINDLRAELTSVSRLAEFSTTQPTLFGLGDTREVRAGVVDGGFFEVMGLQPVLGRLIGPEDDGPDVEGVVVLTHRFWSSALGSDSSVIGQTVRLSNQPATVIGVLEPAVPYPEETEIIANMVTSPHHLSATMVTEREHRMTEVFGRLAPGADVESARAEVLAAYGGMQQSYRDVYTNDSNFRIDVLPLREQLTSRARTILTVILVASGLLFLIACANVVNLVLARTMRRNAELAVRAALLPSALAVRRTLLMESLFLCGLGALVGVIIAQPMVILLSRFASRYSLTALDFQLDATPLWVGVPLALVAAVLLAFVPSLPAAGGATRQRTTASSYQMRGFSVAQVAASFVLLAGAGTVIQTLWALENANPGLVTNGVLAVNLPPAGLGRTGAETRAFYRDVRQRVGELSGVEHAVIGSNVPWRDVGGGPTRLNPRPGGMQFEIEGGQMPASGRRLQARGRAVSPGFFSALGIPLVAGREFNDDDTAGRDRVVIISESIAEALFPGQSAVDRQFRWADPVASLVGFSEEPRRIVGVVADVEDEQVEPRGVRTVYHPFEQEVAGGRLFVVANNVDPYSLLQPIERLIEEMSPEQPVEQASTLDDIRAEVLSPARTNTFVLSVFAGVALLISIVGIGGVLAFSVSARTREFGIRMAIGSQPRDVLKGVLREGAMLGIAGVSVGLVVDWILSRVAGAYIPGLQFPAIMVLVATGVLLVIATIVAALLPALRASRVDPVQALVYD